MKKLAIAAALTLTCALAHASATQLVMRQEMCQNVAYEAEIGYSQRGTDLPNNLDDEILNSWSGGMFAFAYNYGHDRANSRRDAHMVAFGKCLDFIDRAISRKDSPGNYLTEMEIIMN